MNNSEIHLVLVWEKGLDKIDQIMYDLKNNFDIIDVYKISWTSKYFSNNLTRFYGQNLKKGSFKEIHCGKGPFIAIILNQKKPIYDFRKTSNGVKRVNLELFDKKRIYRNWTGGGHKVHTSNDSIEASHDIFFIINKKYDEFKSSDKWDGRIKYIKKDILGCNGWKNFNQLFEFINYSSKYLVLRNYSNLNRDNYDHNDIDFLTSDNNFRYHINGIKKNISKNRAAYQLKIDNKFYSIDIRTLDDYYYDLNWSKKMINDRIKHQNNFFIPDIKNEFYSLLYHSIVHKNSYSDNYIEELKKMATINSIKINPEIFSDKKKMLDILKKFMKHNGYQFTNPKDYSVQYSFGAKGIKRVLWELIGKFKGA